MIVFLGHANSHVHPLSFGPAVFNYYYYLDFSLQIAINDLAPAVINDLLNIKQGIYLLRSGSSPVLVVPMTRGGFHKKLRLVLSRVRTS